MHLFLTSPSPFWAIIPTKRSPSSLTNSIPERDMQHLPPTPTRLANGDIELPNGQHCFSAVDKSWGTLLQYSLTAEQPLVNPFDQYTGTATVSKIFNGGIVTLSGSVARTDYESTARHGIRIIHSVRDETRLRKGRLHLGLVRVLDA